jgi:hypothetical protein
MIPGPDCVGIDVTVISEPIGEEETTASGIAVIMHASPALGASEVSASVQVQGADTGQDVDQVSVRRREVTRFAVRVVDRGP